MTRGELRRSWRMYLATQHDPAPYWKPPQRLSWLEHTWIRIFG